MYLFTTGYSGSHGYGKSNNNPNEKSSYYKAEDYDDKISSHYHYHQTPTDVRKFTSNKSHDPSYQRSYIQQPPPSKHTNNNNQSNNDDDNDFFYGPHYQEPKQNYSQSQHFNQNESGRRRVIPPSTASPREYKYNQSSSNQPRSQNPSYSVSSGPTHIQHSYKSPSNDRKHRNESSIPYQPNNNPPNQNESPRNRRQPPPPPPTSIPSNLAPNKQSPSNNSAKYSRSRPPPSHSSQYHQYPHDYPEYVQHELKVKLFYV